MFPSIPEARWQVSAEDPTALSRLLALPDIDVTGLEYDADKETLIVFCAHRLAGAGCPTCGYWSGWLHQTRRRVVRDVPLGGLPTRIEFVARRFFCGRCGCPFTETLEWLPAYSRLTARYRQHLFACCRQTCLTAVSRREGIGYKTLERLYYALARQQTPPTPPPVRKVGIDEFALRKGYGQYAVAVSDLEAGKVLAVLPDRKKETLLAYFATWTPAQREAVEDLAADLWDTYAQVGQECLPKARRVADRFHVMKNLTERVTEARRDIQQGLPEAARKTLKGCRWLLVRNEIDLSDAERTKLTRMFAVAPDLQRLHSLKEQFRSLFESPVTPAQAGAQLERWITAVEASGLTRLAAFVALLRKHWQPILHYFHERLSSGKVEGLNNKIKVVKRCAYGFGNFDHFALRVLTECDGT